ncbi:MAG TPA: CHRD domain-containing protein [Candidatus Dormibacteraeota bacterium]|nr:CHRD domain-containing protein [Candidatus Dormibacteraeota bacterium]
MRRILWLVPALVAMIGLFGSNVYAERLPGSDHGGLPLAATLAPGNEVPGPGEAGDSGTAQITLNHGQSEVCWELNVVTATKPVAAHIHVGSASVAGPIVVPLSAPVGGVASGCRSVSRELVEAIRDNPSGYYVNVHTTARPGGAIRGQLHR